MRRLLVVDLRGNIQDHVAELMRYRKALPLTPVLPVHDNDGCRAPVFTADPGRQAVDTREVRRDDLDAALLRQVDQIRDRIETQPPVSAKPLRGVFGLGRVAQHRPRGLSWPVPGDARQIEKLLDREIPFQQVQHPGLDPGFLTSARELLLAELDSLQNHVPVADQIVHGHAERVGERDEDAGARHRLVAFVFADRLRGHAVADFGLQIPQRQT